ncbi:PqqD family peptide modification chaperone [Gymnodinialimonas sp.]
MIAAEMDGEVVMMDIEKGSYFSMNAVGSHVWAALETPKTYEGVVADVIDSFDAPDQGQVSADITAFLDMLLSKGLVQRVEA